MSGAPQLQLRLPARPENVIIVRQAVAGLGEAYGLTEQRLADLKTVVTEACNNVVLHAYEDGEGPLDVAARAGDRGIVVTVTDFGSGFRPRADEAEANLGLGLPLIASLSDSFEISGASGQGTRTSVTLYFEAVEGADGNGRAPAVTEATEIAISAGSIARPVLSRVIGALAARADFSVDRLADTVLLGDAVSSHEADDFPDGLVGISFRDSDGTLAVRIGPLVQGAGERILSGMDIPGEEGSLRKLARSMELTTASAPDGSDAEYLEIEVSR